MKQLFNALKSNIQSAQMQSRTTTSGSFWLHNPFSSSFEDNAVYFLSFGVPARPGIAKVLIEANDIGRKAVADFIPILRIVCTISFHYWVRCGT